MAIAHNMDLKSPPSPAPENTALVFVLNGKFLPGLKVLRYSMARQETLLDLPVLFISDEIDVFQDPFVASLGDKYRAVTEKDIKSFSSIPSDRIPDRVKLDWIPKYTFLKWLIYDDYGYDKLIWIDADTVCLRPIDQLLGLNDDDLYA